MEYHGISWNIINFLRTCLSKCDILCLQEHWLFPDSLSFLDSVDLNFKSWGRSSSDLHLDSLNRRGKGGVGFLWRRILDKNITFLEELGNDRIIVLKVNLSLHNTLFIVVLYLPTSNESINIFKAYLGTLDEILCSLEHDGTVMIVGDFNTHIGNLGGPRCLSRINGQGTYLDECLEKYDFVSINSQSFCQGAIATFYAVKGLVTTTVDHIFIQQSALSLVLDPIVVEDCSSNLSFHLPISCTVKADLKMEKRKQDKHAINWKKLSSSDLQKYGTEVTARLQEISIMY